MPAYCFRCVTCGESHTIHSSIGNVPKAPVCYDHGEMRRDYRSEGVSVESAVGQIRREEASTDKANANVRDILPTSDDFLKKARGDRKRANKEIREWNARHEPADPKGNRYRPQEI